MTKDSLDLELTGASPQALAHYERSLHELQCFVGDPVASVEQAIAASPGFVMAHVLKGYLFGLATEREASAIAAQAHAAAVPAGGTAREKAHVAALGALAGGRWHAASALLEDIAIDYPRDALALQVGHQIDFFTGDSRMLRDRIARALPSWAASMPGYHAMLGMHAFGLEETGDYARAEEGRPQRHRDRAARRLGAARGGACHGNAEPAAGRHRLDARQSRRRGRRRASSRSTIGGIWRCFTSISARSTRCSKLYDGPIYGTPSTLALNMVDASALLWRLHLGGADVGDRWEAIAANWAPKAGDGNYAFNDAHAMMAFVGAGLADRPRR